METRTGSPVTVALSWPQRQDATLTSIILISQDFSNPAPIENEDNHRDRNG